MLKPGETKELMHRFETAGASLAGCHVAGHYAGGMKATITVTEKPEAEGLAQSSAQLRT